MTQSVSEKQVSFEDTLKWKMDTLITFNEATALLSDFYKEKVENIIRWLPPESKNTTTKSIMFKNSVNNGHPCIRMIGYNEKQEEIWSRLLDKYSGQPQAKIG